MKRNLNSIHANLLTPGNISYTSILHQPGTGKKNPNAIGTKPALTSRVTIRQLGKTTQSWVMTLIKNTLIVLIAANGTEPGTRVCAAE